MIKPYAITIPNGTTRYVYASTRQNACRKLTGMREAAAKAANQIQDIKRCKAA